MIIDFNRYNGGGGEAYTAGANINISAANVISVSGLATVNGSALTNGGNIEIQGGGDMDILKAVDEFPADPELGDMVSKLSYPAITSWDLSHEAKTHLDPDNLDTEGTYTIATFESDSGATDVVLMYDDGEDAWVLSVDVGGDAVGDFILSEDSAETSVHIVNQYYASIGWVKDDFSGLGGMMLSIRKTNGTFNQVDGSVTDIPDFKTFDIVGTWADPETDGPAYYDGEKWVNVADKVKKETEAIVSPRMPYLALSDDIDSTLSAIFDDDGGGNPKSTIYLLDTAYDWVDNNVDWEGDADVRVSFTIDPDDEDGPVAYIENIPAGNYIFGLYKEEPGENYDSEFWVSYYSKEIGGYDDTYVEATNDVWNNPDLAISDYWRSKFGGNVVVSNGEDYNWSFPKDVARFEIRVVDDGEGNLSVETNIVYKEKVYSSDGSINNIVKIEQSAYDQLVNDGETDSNTLYVVVPDSN